MKGIQYDHLVFKSEAIAVEFRKVLQNRRAQDIRWLDDNNGLDNKSRASKDE